MFINIKSMKDAGFVVETKVKHGTIAIYPEHPVQPDFEPLKAELESLGVHVRDAEDGIEAMMESISIAEIVRAIKGTS